VAIMVVGQLIVTPRVVEVFMIHWSKVRTGWDETPLEEAM